MARTQVVDSATCQFFVNLKDNAFLDHRDRTAQGFGYAVFGRVIAGMDVVDRIAGVATGRKGMHENVPLEPVVVRRASAS
jgi:cyclophilin family peptidyl-prolyl cis-trans isomerase